MAWCAYQNGMQCGEYWSCKNEKVEGIITDINLFSIKLTQDKGNGEMITYTIPGNFKTMSSVWVRVFSKESPTQREWQQPNYHPFVARLGLMVMEFGWIIMGFAIILLVLNSF